jgi:catechol 2,3-dioxygenase
MSETVQPFALTRPAYVRNVHLVARDLGVVSGFYQKIIGLDVIERTASGKVLGVGGAPLLTLTTRRDIAPAPRNAAGLFHTAFLVPDRDALAHWLSHAVDSGVALDGASDHLVSEALYLSDPEGNGIEIYRDRRPDEWNYGADGTVAMATERLNLQELYGRAPKQAWSGMAQGTSVGHIHLQVGDIPQADAFYRDVLGLKIMARYPGASFFATGGYHHHIAANIWSSRGARQRADGMTGLSDYAIRFNDKDALDRALVALERHEIATTKTAEGHALHDHWGIGITLLA